MTDERDSTAGESGVARELGRFAEDVARDWALHGAVLFGVLILFALPSAGPALRVITVAVSAAAVTVT